MTEFGLAVIELYKTHTVSQICKILGKSEPAVRRWIKPDTYYNQKTMETKKRHKQKKILEARNFVDCFKIEQGCCSCDLKSKTARIYDCCYLSDKKIMINTMVRHGYRIEKIKIELEKCVVMCANCNRIRVSDLKNSTNTYNNEKSRFILSNKKNAACSKCGIKDHRVLDSHHIDKNSKIGGIGSMIRDTRYSLDNLINELNKCEYLCVNCHRELHALEDSNLEDILLLAVP